MASGWREGKEGEERGVAEKRKAFCGRERGEGGREGGKDGTAKLLVGRKIVIYEVCTTYQTFSRGGNSF